MNLYDAIATLSADLVAAGGPQGIVDHHCDALVQVLIQVGRNERAANLLPKHGAVVAAGQEHCHKVTIYRRAKRYAKVAFSLGKRNG